MSSVLPTELGGWSAADLVERFGDIPLWRIHQTPRPGTATAQDVLEIHVREGRLCELVDGVLVEKDMGTRESYLAVRIANILAAFVDERQIGFLLGSDGMTRLFPDLVRIPDVSFIAWETIGQRHVPESPMLETAPDLVVEVISPGNTDKEMRDKLADYFSAGIRMAWYVHPQTRTIEVFSSPQAVTTLSESDVLMGNDVLPDFEVLVSRIFVGLQPPSETA